jgi:hypothetical protein
MKAPAMLTGAFVRLGPDIGSAVRMVGQDVKLPCCLAPLGPDTHKATAKLP